MFPISTDAGNRWAGSWSCDSVRTHARRSNDAQAIDSARLSVEHAIEALRRGDRHVEAALVSAGMKIVDGDTAAALADLDRMLDTSPAGPAGWIIPVDPMLAPIREAPGIQAVLSRLAARAA